MENETHHVVEEGCLSNCAKENIDKYQSLSEVDLNAQMRLPCGCEYAYKKDLVNSYACTQCDTKYIFSFCLDEAVTEESTWHCEFCGSC